MRATLACTLILGCSGGSSMDQPDAAIDASIDSGPTLPRVFVTSTLHSSKLATNGMASVDQLCTTIGKRFSTRPFVAWLSAANTPMGQASGRFTYQGPWYRLDGQLVADSLAGLLASKPKVPIAIDETGAAVAPAAVWTATIANGTPSTYDCEHWTGGNPNQFPNSGLVGEATSIDDWTGKLEGRAVGCSGTARLYCFEQ